MIEEITPQLLMATLLLLLLVVPVVTLILSLLLLWRYRRAVIRAMDASAGHVADGAEGVGASAGVKAGDPPRVLVGGSDASDLLGLARHAPGRNALRYLTAGAAFALVMAVAAHFVYPSGLGLPGFLVAIWIYIWPGVLAATLVVPANLRHWLVWLIAYLVAYGALGIWAGTVLNLPEYRFGAVVIPARSSVTPEGMIRVWLAANGAPTLLMVLCLNRWIRAIAPLLLSLVTAALAGMLAMYFALFSPRGVDTAVAMATQWLIDVRWLVAAALGLALLVFGLTGWLLMRWISHAYRSNRLSDQMLLLDALWLLFASAYAMWLVKGGLLWLASVPLAFAAYRLTWSLAAPLTSAAVRHAHDLTFLRVFSLGRRSEALFERVAGHWRHIGSIQLITGPDLAVSTVQPHQFLDFLGGKLTRHFVSDRISLENALRERDLDADPDGRYRVNNFFCHADSWKSVLARLVAEGDTVLMDLRRFSSDNAGCTHEIRQLVAEVPLKRCVLLVDESSDRRYLDRVIADAMDRLPPHSPNYRQPVDAILTLRSGTKRKTATQIVGRLCAAAVR